MTVVLFFYSRDQGFYNRVFSSLTELEDQLEAMLKYFYDHPALVQSIVAYPWILSALHFNGIGITKLKFVKIIKQNSKERETGFKKNKERSKHGLKRALVDIV